jgi:hypothetical protein
MSDEPLPVDEVRLEEFRSRLKERGVETLACPACGQDAWGGFANGGINVLTGRNPDTGTVEGIVGSVHALLAVCGKCGFIAAFDRDVIGG